MSIPLRVVAVPRDESGLPDYWSASPGDTWPCTVRSHGKVEGRGPCWVVRLPGGGWVFHTNMPASNGGGYWVVTGEPPNLTVRPSINVGPEIWHGHITDGHLEPDVDAAGEP